MDEAGPGDMVRFVHVRRDETRSRRDWVRAAGSSVLVLRWRWRERRRRRFGRVERGRRETQWRIIVTMASDVDCWK